MQASLAVNEHDVVVVPPWEATHGWLAAEAGMGPGAIIMLQPARQHPGAIGGGVVGPRIGPLAQQGLDEALGLAVGAGGVGARALMGEPQGAAGGAKAAGAIARSIVREETAHAPPARADPGEGPPHEAPGGVAVFVGQQLDIGHARPVVHRHMDTLPAGAMALPVPLARGAVAQIRDAPQLL